VLYYFKLHPITKQKRNKLARQKNCVPNIHKIVNNMQTGGNVITGHGTVGRHTFTDEWMA
jgi:hypothetical protein